MDTVKRVWLVSVLVLVLEKCENEQKCVVRAATRQFGDDPCPSTSKYLQVAYQCRPNEFRSRVACEGQTLTIQCRKSQRIAVYSASYGRSERGDDQCPLSPGQFPDVCEADCAARSVMQVCHGKRRCRLEARRENFGDPCRPGVSPYLSVVYTCVPRRILREMRSDDTYPHTFCQEESTTVQDNNNNPPSGDQGTDGASDLTPEGGWHPGGTHSIGDGEEANVPPPSTEDYNNITPVTQSPSHNTDSSKNKTEPCITVEPAEKSGNTSEGENFMGLVKDWMGTVDFIKANKEKFILYAVLSLCVGIIGVLLIVIIRLVQSRHKIKTQAKMDITDPIPSSSPPPPHDDFTSALLNGNHTHAQGDTSGEEAVEPINYNFGRAGVPPFPTDTGTRSFNNYYG